MKIMKKIIAALLVITFICENAISTYSKETVFNQEVAVGETVQLKIPAGANEITWETSSKRIATVSKKGELTGVKTGECDIFCKAVYPKFIIFKDEVNYVFHVKVLKNKKNDDEDINVENLLLQNNGNGSSQDDSYFVAGVQNNFSFDIKCNSNIETAYEIINVKGTKPDTKVQSNLTDIYTILPKEKYDNLMTYIVTLSDNAEFINEDYKEYKKLMFMTDGEEFYNEVLNEKVVDKVIKVDKSKIKKVENNNTLSNAEDVSFNIEEKSLNTYSEGQIIVIDDNETQGTTPYKIEKINANGVTVKKAKLDEVYDEFEMHSSGVLKIPKEELKKNELVFEDIKKDIVDAFMMTSYAAKLTKSNPEFTIDTDEMGYIYIDIKYPGIEIYDHITGCITLHCKFQVNRNIYFNISDLENLLFEFSLLDNSVDIGFQLEGEYGTEIHDNVFSYEIVSNETEIINDIKEALMKKAKEGSWRRNLIHWSFDAMDFFGTGVSMSIRNQIQKTTKKSIGTLGVSFDVDLMNYILASLTLNAYGEFGVDVAFGFSNARGPYVMKLSAEKFSSNLTFRGKIKDTLQIPNVKVQVYLLSEDFFSMRVEGGIEATLLAAGDINIEIFDKENLYNLPPLAGIIELSLDAVFNANIHVDLMLNKIEIEIIDFRKHLVEPDRLGSDIIGLSFQHDTYSIMETYDYIPIKKMYTKVIDLESGFLDVKNNDLSIDENIKFYSDSEHTEELKYVANKGIEVNEKVVNGMTIYAVYNNLYYATTLIEVKPEETTTIPVTAETIETIPVETEAPVLIGGGARMEGKVEVVVDGSNNTMPVQNAKVEFYNTNNESQLVTHALTDSDGNFSVSLPAGDYKLITSAEGYVSLESYETARLNSTKYVEIYILFSENQQGVGSAAGKITSSVTGQGLDDVNIRLKKGWNNIDDYDFLDEEFTTDSSGKYKIEDVDVGYYTIVTEKDGYVQASKNILVLKDHPFNDYNFSINPEMADDGDIRIVLNWGSSPYDLDSHLIGLKPNSDYFDVYYNDKIYTYEGDDMVNLDVDVISSYGPETITITNDINGVYIYGVHDYSNRNNTSSKSLSNSNCTVTVYSGDIAIDKFSIPTNRTGTFWEVFEIDENKNITQINKIYNYSPLDKDFSEFDLK